MKRHESIAALSRDHHIGLLFCWKIRQGIKNQISLERMRSYTGYFWDSHLKQHFEEEETFLFIGIQDSLCKQAIEEHKRIRTLIEIIVAIGTKHDLNELANLLDKHIRFEERTLFPYLERVLSADTLITIGNRLQEQHKFHEEDNYPDEFWI